MRNTKIDVITGEASCLTRRLEASSVNFLISNFAISVLSIPYLKKSLSKID